MIRLTFWKALMCRGCHNKGMSFFINCRRGSEVCSMTGENLFRWLTIPVKVCTSARFCGTACRWCLFNFEVVMISSQSIRGPRKPPKRCLVYFKLDLVWVQPYIIVPCCVKDVEYVLIMLLFTFAINKSIICNSTQAIKLSKYGVHFLLEHLHCRDVHMVAFSICTFPMGYWRMTSSMVLT